MNEFFIMQRHLAVNLALHPKQWTSKWSPGLFTCTGGLKVTLCLSASRVSWRSGRMTAGTVVITGGILATVILLCIIVVLCYCRLQVSAIHTCAFDSWRKKIQLFSSMHFFFFLYISLHYILYYYFTFCLFKYIWMNKLFYLKETSDLNVFLFYLIHYDNNNETVWCRFFLFKYFIVFNFFVLIDLKEFTFCLCCFLIDLSELCEIIYL